MPTTQEIQCAFCNKLVIKSIKRINEAAKLGYKQVCSKECRESLKTTSFITNCQTCNAQIKRRQSDIVTSKSGFVFCSHKCSAIYSNTHKTSGTRRSKLEIWLETNLTMTYPSILIQYNCKDAINSELDIFIPSLNLAFELNGIFHYEPIYGVEKLKSIQNNDTRKFQACLERGIELCIINTSEQKHASEKSNRKYLNIINTIINNKLSVDSKVIRE